MSEQTKLDGEAVTFITAVIAGTIIFLAILGSVVAANINWAPHAADIRIQELQLQITCIQAGGISDQDGRCVYSKAAS